MTMLNSPKKYFFPTMKQLRLSRPVEDLLKIFCHFPGTPADHAHVSHTPTPPQTSSGGNIREGSAASWLDSGGPSQFSRKMQGKESPPGLKREKNSKFIMISSPGLPRYIFSFLHTVSPVCDYL